jgi:broad specificity phosphatase PhoE
VSRSELWLIRHGETEWSLSGAHTGKSEINLTEQGRQLAPRIGTYLKDTQFALVLTSPRQRARETCCLAGFTEALVDEDLSEWDYGLYEGRTLDEIRKENSKWSIWQDGVPGGETINQVADRANRIIDRSVAAGGPVALFSHGHLLRILAACWVGLPPEAGRIFAIGTGTICTLGFKRDTRVISKWNVPVE